MNPTTTPNLAASPLAPDPATSRGSGGYVRAVIRASRPKQWTKNLLVLAAPLAAGRFDADKIAGEAALAFVAFCVISSGGYLINDRRDYWRDRLHPTKQSRPVASGAVSLTAATVLGIVFCLVGVGLAALVSLPFAVCAVVYLLIAFAYSFGLREVVLMDVATVASLFIVRAVAGGVATHVPLSRWFLVVTSFAALFIVCGKRASEFQQRGEARGTSRQTLDQYSSEYLRGLCLMSATVAITAYCLWAFDRRPTGEIPWQELSIAPFLLGMMRYGMLIDRGVAATPEQALLSDRFLRIIAVAWAAVFCLGAYAVG
jgi:decaprenyl-phosphate phosphoribosyltransferase